MLTGLAEGDYYFRIRDVGSGDPNLWSNVVHVQVAFMERSKVVLLLVTGAVVVLFTASAILFGQKRTRLAQNPS